MFQSLFNSMSGLFSFSRSLDTVSNNVANMNTPGFRGSDSFFENVSGGRGTRIAGDGMRTTAGDLRQTGNATDVAIDGAGFFVLRDEGGNLHYTRAGQFLFDEQGYLVDSVSRFRVMSTDEGGRLIPVSLEGYRTLPAEPTTRISLAGNLAPDGTTHEVAGVTVYDANGGAHTLSIGFTNNEEQTPRSFLVSVKDESGTEVATGEIRFSVSGTLEPAFNVLELNLVFAGIAQSVELDFGVPGTFQGTTNLAGLSNNVGATVEDGRSILGITLLSFDENGVLQFSYGSSEKRSGQQLALASFFSEGILEMSGGRLISDADSQRSDLGWAGGGAFGKIKGGSLEMSNIDLTQEFADMLIIQRGYQASSRVMSVGNEMIEQLYNSTRGG